MVLLRVNSQTGRTSKINSTREKVNHELMKTAVTQTCARDRNFSLSLLAVGQTSKTKVTSGVSHLWSKISSSSLRCNDLKHVIGYLCRIQCFVIVIYVLQQRNREAVMLKSRVRFRCHRNFRFCYLHCEM